MNKTPEILPRKALYRKPEILRIECPFNQKVFDKTTGRQKYESTEQMVFGGFGKYEQTKMLAFSLKNNLE
ncbi:MAG: hypothetical protein ABR595_10875 [Psychroflexus sp.]